MTSDTSIMFGIISFFVLMGAILPFVNVAFGADASGLNVDQLQTQVGQEPPGFFTVASSVLLMFFWTFGSLPFLVDIIFVPLRIILGVIVIRIGLGVVN